MVQGESVSVGLDPMLLQTWQAGWTRRPFAAFFRIAAAFRSVEDFLEGLIVCVARMAFALVIVAAIGHPAVPRNGEGPFRGAL